MTLKYSPLKYQIDGVAYGFTGIVSFGSFFVNLHSILVYGVTPVSLFLILGDLSSIILAFSSHLTVFIDDNVFIILVSGLTFAMQISTVINYPTQRSRKLLHKKLQKVATGSPFVLGIVCFLRSISYDGLLDYLIPLLMFFIVAPLAYILCLYSFYKIGHLIRSNPSSYQDMRQIRIEKISNVTLVIGGVLQFIAMLVSQLEYYQLFVKSVMSMTSFVFSFSEFLMTLNKNTEIEYSIVMSTNMSYFSNPSELKTNQSELKSDARLFREGINSYI